MNLVALLMLPLIVGPTQLSGQGRLRSHRRVRNSCIVSYFWKEDSGSFKSITLLVPKRIRNDGEKAMRSPRGFHNNAMNLLYRFIPVSLAFLLLTTTGCSKTEDKKEILVGEFGALSGKYSQYGISTGEGIQVGRR